RRTVPRTRPADRLSRRRQHHGPMAVAADGPDRRLDDRPGAAKMNPLARRLRRVIESEGPISVAAFMDAALSDPDHGYYRTRDPLGRAGDFTTAPEVSQMFGELIGLWAAVAWREIGAPDPVDLIEL